MLYSKLYLRRKSPGWILIAAGVMSLLLLFFLIAIPQHKTPTQYGKRQIVLDSVEVVNVSSTQVSILWNTPEKEINTIVYNVNDKNLSSLATDDRDTDKLKNKYTYHLVTLRDLIPDTDYYFKIIADTRIYTEKDSRAFHLRTLKSGVESTMGKPVYGKVLSANGKPSENTIVVMRVAEAYPLVTISKETGEWLIPANILISRVTGKPIQEVNDNQKVFFSFLNESISNTQLTTTYKNLSYAGKTVVLGNTYSYLTDAAAVLGASVDSSGQSMGKITIVYPKENALIPAQKPLFKGTGIPGAEVILFINSKPQFSYRTTIDPKGEWRVLPTAPISPGTYQVVVTTKDEKGAKISMKRSFMIAKGGEQVLGEATAEPTLIPTVTQVPTVTSVQPTSVVPSVIAPSDVPTITPFASPTTVVPTVLQTYPTTPPPETGGNFSGFYIASLILFVVGSALVLAF